MSMSVITEYLSQTQIGTNLLRLQNTTFQTCSRSKYSPIIPRLIFKASLFSLSPPTTNPRTSSREKQRRWGKHLNLAFREWSGRCLEIFHILFTPGRFQPGNHRELAGPPPGHNSSLSFLSAPCLPRPKSSVCKPFHATSFLSTPSNLKQTRLARSAARARRNIYGRGGIEILIKGILFMQTKCSQITQHSL